MSLSRNKVYSGFPVCVHMLSASVLYPESACSFLLSAAVLCPAGAPLGDSTCFFTAWKDYGRPRARLCHSVLLLILVIVYFSSSSRTPLHPWHYRGSRPHALRQCDADSGLCATAGLWHHLLTLMTCDNRHCSSKCVTNSCWTERDCSENMGLKEKFFFWKDISFKRSI